MKSWILIKSEKETIKLAEEFVKEVLEGAKKDKPLIFWLEGELGAGKTQFVKGIAKTLGIKERITSPTFVLMKKFIIPTGKKAGPGPALDGKPRKAALPLRGKSLFFHLDCYRIYDSEDAKQIGLDEIIKSSQSIIAIEWAERIAEIIPKPYWEIKLEHTAEKKRKISIKNVK